MANEQVATDEEIGSIREYHKHCGGSECADVRILLNRIDADAARIAELTSDRDEAIGVAQKRAERIVELEYEVSVYLKRIDEAQARMSNLQSDGVESERARIVALLRYGRTDGGETITSSKHAAEVIERGDHGLATPDPAHRR